MKREILFKGKRKDNGQWVEGFYVYDKPWGEHKIMVYDNITTNRMLIITVDPETVCESTGSPVKNSKIIFEGDRIKEKESEHSNEYRIYTVFWNDEKLQWWMIDVDTLDPQPLEELDTDLASIIGSIHDKEEE